MAAFCFSLLVEAVQTLIHIDHQDTMHHPMAVIALGLAGLVLNAICYLLIGGYTYHQGSFLHITSAGDVVLERVVSSNGVRSGERRLSKTRRDQAGTPTSSVGTKLSGPADDREMKQGRKHTTCEVLRDVCSESTPIPYSFSITQSQFSKYLFWISTGTLFVIICAVIVFFANNENVTKFIDPVMSIASCIALLWLSFPYSK